MTTLDLIDNERVHQIEKGYDDKHDDAHTDGEIAYVAGQVLMHCNDQWGIYAGEPDRIRQLVIAAALVVAEIERLMRARIRAEAHERPIAPETETTTPPL